MEKYGSPKAYDKQKETPWKEERIRLTAKLLANVANTGAPVVMHYPEVDRIPIIAPEIDPFL